MQCFTCAWRLTNSNEPPRLFKGNIRSAKFLMGTKPSASLAPPASLPWTWTKWIPKSIPAFNSQVWATEFTGYSLLHENTLYLAIYLNKVCKYVWWNGNGTICRRVMEWDRGCSKYVKQVGKRNLGRRCGTITSGPMGRLLLHSGLISLGTTRNRKRCQTNRQPPTVSIKNPIKPKNVL